MLNDSGNLDFSHQFPAFYLLAGFGLEVAMKCHLRHLGVPDVPDLKAVGHDLEKAAQLLSDRMEPSDQPLPANLGDVVRRLGPAHRDLTMRYPAHEVNIMLPHPASIMEVLTPLVDDMLGRLAFE
ncbi:MAG: hypothetical protein JWM76_1423 [Pseudonocardiales bacterium]|nr:hypothetical protein [Pseudonocardiales bacterium]